MPCSGGGGAFAHRIQEIVHDGAIASLLSVGHRTGLFDALADRPRCSAEALAAAAGGRKPARLPILFGSTRGSVRVKLDFLTANLWGLPWPAARARRDRKRRFAEHLRNRAYDVVGIQELWWPWRRTLRHASLILPRRGRDSGLAIAARLPVRGEVEIEHFNDHAGFDRIKRKGAIGASIETPSGAALSVWVAHLQAGRRHAAVRGRQLTQLLERLERDRGPVVLMGDFNLHADEEEDGQSAERLHSAGFVDAALALSRGEATYERSNPFVRRRDGDERFDRVYLRDADDVRLHPLEADVLRVQPLPLSDHHPLRVRIHLSA